MYVCVFVRVCVCSCVCVCVMVSLKQQERVGGQAQIHPIRLPGFQPAAFWRKKMSSAKHNTDRKQKLLILIPSAPNKVLW